ncbi:hypothetical protein [Subtercola boreus]|uniref:Uncharacterized protein n=1 Tax=Subtercola boreus TaxID=120213 RepID=A0A3E0WH09_9MICO|nr:hypothetical protein [Subtercola boreus]RFA23421.1 hypothetical protein B7R24_00540 [Subtercola boreus]RFA23814.1 hypothetical protein B7R23_00540 [Subtercola boreus]RFA29515.1 hypothetical protein B7R25_00535 [Subtercola boreus]
MTSSEPTPPTRRQILKPVELVLISAVLALFVGLTVLLATRQPVLSIVFFGIAFIVSLVVIAMFTLTFKPNEAEQQELRSEDELGGGGVSGPYLGPGPKGH